MKETTQQRRKRLGLCINCEQQSVPGKLRCQKHTDHYKATYHKNKEARHEYNKRKQQERIAEKKDAGLCIVNGCTNDCAIDKVSCNECAKKSALRKRKLRQKVFDHYGAFCHCSCECKVTNPNHLTIDHKNNDGAIQRRKHGLNSNDCRRIIKDGYPEDLQILCWNCNCAKQFFGGCET